MAQFTSNFFDNNNNNINNNNNNKQEISLPQPVSDSFQPSKGMSVISAPNLQKQQLQQQLQQQLKQQQQKQFQQISKPFRPSVPLGSTDEDVVYGKGHILQTTNLIMDALAQRQQQQQLLLLQQQQSQQQQQQHSSKFNNVNQNFLHLHGSPQQVQLPVQQQQQQQQQQLPNSFPYPIIPPLSPSSPSLLGNTGQISISSGMTNNAIYANNMHGGGGGQHPQINALHNQQQQLLLAGRRQDEEGWQSSSEAIDENQVQYPVEVGVEGWAEDEDMHLHSGSNSIKCQLHL